MERSTEFDSAVKSSTIVSNMTFGAFGNEHANMMKLVYAVIVVGSLKKLL